MENSNQDKNDQQTRQVPVETDYAKHEANPAPAPTVNEPDHKGAGLALKWIIPITVILLLILWYLFFRDRTPEL